MQARKQLKTLVESPGWDLLVEWGVSQRDFRTESLLAPAEGLDQVFRSEYMKGEVAGIQLFFNFPEAIIEELDRMVEQADLVDQKEEEDQ